MTRKGLIRCKTKQPNHQVSRTLLSILTGLISVVVWMVSILPLISSSHGLFSGTLRTVPKAPTTIDNTITYWNFIKDTSVKGQIGQSQPFSRSSESSYKTRSHKRIVPFLSLPRLTVLAKTHIVQAPDSNNSDSESTTYQLRADKHDHNYEPSTEPEQVTRNN